MGWVESLLGYKVGLDTAPVIYFSEEMATAITMEAAFFLTNDIHLPSLPNLKILMLDDLLKEG